MRVWFELKILFFKFLYYIILLCVGVVNIFMFLL